MAILVIEHSPSAGALRLAATLQDYGHRLRIVATHDGDPIPVDLDDVDGIVSCGGPQSANDVDPALAAEMALLVEAHERQIPVVGLCLGCQLLAKALGGTIAPLQGGREIGWHPVHFTDAGRDDILFTGIGWDTTQFQWHGEHVAELPKGARLLASSKRCKVQAFASGLRSYGFQFHPEVDLDTIKLWIDEEPEQLAAAEITASDLVVESQRDYPAFARITDRLFENVASLLMPVERRFRGLVKDMHH